MNTWKQRLAYGLGLSVLATTMACGGAPVPQTQLVEAKTSTSAAEAVGARDEPTAALHLKMAEDAIAEAEKDIADGKNDEALPLLQRARSDAELAQALTREVKTKESADAAVGKLNTLEKDLRMQAGRS